MHFSQVKILLVAADAVHLTKAHTTFTNFSSTVLTRAMVLLYA